MEVQEQASRKWVRDNGHCPVAVTTDEGISGGNGLDTRLGLAEAFELLRDGGATGLVAYRLDRLARDLVLHEQLLAEIRRMGAEVFSTSQAEAGYLTDDPSYPSRKLIRQVLGAVSENERAMIALRLKSGRARKSENGGFAYGSFPFGFKAEGKALVPDETEQRTLARIRELRDSGRFLRQIATALDNEHLPPRKAVHWHPYMVGRALARRPSLEEERRNAG